jgi:hypothetical protein
VTNPYPPVSEPVIEDFVFSETLADPVPVIENPYPDPIIPVEEDKLERFTIWLEQWLYELEASHAEKITEWADQEEAYRARVQGKKTFPFVGACNDVVPLIAMAVDPIHARLDTGIFKSDPVFSFKPLKKSVVDYVDPLSRWVEYYQKHKLGLRTICSPRLLECAKHGTMVLKTVYDRETYTIKTYDKSWKVVSKEVTRFSGPRVAGISLNDFLFPPSYQHLQDCPIVAERIRTTYWDLKIAQASGKVTNCDKVLGQETLDKTELERERETSAKHTGSALADEKLEIFEVWCDYDINGDGLPERLVATYHRPTRTFLQLRYNWYFHQRKPYTVIPYSITNDSLYGIGIAEMTKPFQSSITDWERLARDNGYLANIRMFIAKKESGIEQAPRLFSGRVFHVDDPSKDFIPFAGGDIYPSTLRERQNILGLAEKRTGVSDYLTGRESPIVGSRATATSTVALIQEGTKRVEEVLENVRQGLAEVIENCIYIWMQYGLDGLDDLVFGDDDLSVKLKEFFTTVDADNVAGAFAVSLTTTDAAGNRVVQQQTKLSILQVMMQYLEKLLQAGQAAVQSQQQMPQYSALVVEVMTAARRMFKDLLQTYEIRNPEDYLPDLEEFINGLAQGQSGAGDIAGLIEQLTAGQGVPSGPPQAPGPQGPSLPIPGGGGGSAFDLQAAGAQLGL